LRCLNRLARLCASMFVARVFPVLLFKGEGLVKGVQFKDHRYVGDPMNAIRIFNQKSVDEIAIIDIAATRENRSISPELVRKVAGECFIPMMVGGGIRTHAQARELFSAGAEKVLLNTFAFEEPECIRRISEAFGSQAVVISIDVKNKNGKYFCYTRCGEKEISLSPVEAAQMVESHGAGEILINSIDRDGTGLGYDLDITAQISKSVSIPVVAMGGCGSMDHIRDAITTAKASAAAAGSFFVFHGRRRAVLISFPDEQELFAAVSGA